MSARMTTLTLFMVYATHAASAADVVVDEKTWAEMTAAMAQVSMPLPAHQNVQTILQAVKERSAKASAEPIK